MLTRSVPGGLISRSGGAMSDENAEQRTGDGIASPGEARATRLDGSSNGPGPIELERDPVHSINQRIFETSLDLILVVDKRGSFARVSPSSETIIGYRPEELVGRSAREILYPEDLDATREEMRLARRGRTMRNFECRYVHRDGHAVPLTWMGVWSEEDGQHFFIGRDMTERIRLESQLRQAQKMEAVGLLTGGVAHDFNNLLAVVTGSVELILDQPGLTPEAIEHANNALHAAETGAELTRRLLAFARQQPLEPKVVDANGLIRNMTTLLGRILGQNIDIRFSGAPELGSVLIDPANLESALANLAVNARDAMPDGGRLTIETANATLDEEYARLNPEAKPGEYVSVIVTDTGTGMTPEVLERIFEPFFTTKESGRGTGLGLSMVFGFIKQSGGHIKAYSEAGHGTSIRVYLPRSGELHRMVETASKPQAPQKAAQRARILVVEDSKAIRQVVLTQLARLGYETLEAEDPAAALKILDAGEPIDLLFTDIVMPGGMSGLVLAREALKRRPGLKVLFTSGFPGAHVAAGDEMVRADAMIGKPYRFQELAEKIRGALERTD
jgi:PAS domain S-box-containing protein